MHPVIEETLRRAEIMQAMRAILATEGLSTYREFSSSYPRGEQFRRDVEASDLESTITATIGTEPLTVFRFTLADIMLEEQGPFFPAEYWQPTLRVMEEKFAQRLDTASFEEAVAIAGTLDPERVEFALEAARYKAVMHPVTYLIEGQSNWGRKAITAAVYRSRYPPAEPDDLDSEYDEDEE